MPDESNGTDEHESRYVTDSPDNLSDVEPEDHDPGALVRNGHARLNAHESEDDRTEDGEEYEKDGDRDSEEDVEEDDEDDEEDEDEEDDEDDDEEPALKYERLGGSTQDLLRKDSASAIAYSHERLVSAFIRLYALAKASTKALGTHAGVIHVLDLHGERLKSIKPHSASILDVSLDETGDFIATASMDGESILPRCVARLTSVPRTGRHILFFDTRSVPLRHEATHADDCYGTELREAQYTRVCLRRDGWEPGHAREGLARTQGDPTAQWRGSDLAGTVEGAVDCLGE